MSAVKNKKEVNTAGIRIKENSWVAKLAAKRLCTGTMAIVIGKTIHLHNTARQDFLSNDKWLKHEMCHVNQFQQFGFVLFTLKYLWESVKKGYHNNKYEVEARKAEDL